MLTRILVPKPKKAFQSPGVQSDGLKAVVVVSVIHSPTPRALNSWTARWRAPAIALSTCSRTGDPAEDAALSLDHRQARLLELREIGTHAVGQHEAAEAAVVGFAHRGVDADFGGDAADDELLDAAVAQDQLEVGGVERALARLVDHRLAGDRVELRDDVVPGLALHQNPAHRPRIADALARRAAHDLGRRRVGQIGAMALAGVDDQHAGLARRRQHLRRRLDRGLEQADIVAEGFAESARLEKIALHVDDDQRGTVDVQSDRLRFGGDGGS